MTALITSGYQKGFYFLKVEKANFSGSVPRGYKYTHNPSKKTALFVKQREPGEYFD
jgi:hypothetical protein